MRRRFELRDSVVKTSASALPPKSSATPVPPTRRSRINALGQQLRDRIRRSLSRQPLTDAAAAEQQQQLVEKHRQDASVERRQKKHVLNNPISQSQVDLRLHAVQTPMKEGHMDWRAVGSQPTVFDDRSAFESKMDVERKTPSYVNLSLANYGYRRSSPAPRSITSSGTTTTAASLLLLQSSGVPSASSAIGMKSMVERRVEQLLSRSTTATMGAGTSQPALNTLKLCSPCLKPTAVNKHDTNCGTLPFRITVNNDEKTPTSSDLSSPDDQSKMPSDDASSAVSSEGYHTESSPQKEENDGQDGSVKRFERLAAQLRDRIERLADEAERELVTLSEDNPDRSDRLRAAAGNARLLLRKKMACFERQICDHKAGQNSEGRKVELADLRGFWEMMQPAVEDVLDGFSRQEDGPSVERSHQKAEQDDGDGLRARLRQREAEAAERRKRQIEMARAKAAQRKAVAAATT